MARQDALAIISNTEQDQLAEIYGDVIEAVQKGAISEQIKNTNYSGEPTSGSVEISRFSNAVVQNYGNARSAGEGVELDNSGKVTININEDKEIVEEVERKDLKLHGVVGLAERRKNNYAKRISADLDRRFFTQAENEGTELTGLNGDIVAKLEQLIQNVETTVNQWVDGVDREMLVLCVTPYIYGLLRDYIDIVTNPNIDSSQNEIKVFRDVRIFSNHRQTAHAICMIEGAIGQPVTYDTYDLEKIPQSNAFSLQTFFSRGTKAVMPDLIKVVTDLEDEE